MSQKAIDKNKAMGEHFLKRPPQSNDAEQSVLGGLLLNSSAFDDVAAMIESHDFYRLEHRVIFAAIEKLVLQNIPVDTVTLLNALANEKQLDEAGGETYLFELANNTPSIVNIGAYAKIVHDKSLLRKLIEVSTHITDVSFSPGELSVADIIEQAESKIFTISEKTNAVNGKITQKEALSKAVSRIDRLYHANSEMVGLETGFKDFDQLTKGLQKQDMIVIAARPSMGKTTLAMNIVEHVATRLEKPILIASLEMAEEQLMTRMISSLGSIEHERIFSGKLLDEDWSKFSAAVQKINQTNITFVVDGFMSVAMLRAQARRVMKEHGELGLIVIDYLQLMSCRNFKENRTMEITAISRELKLLAKELDVPVIVISQLNRGLEQRADKRPMLSDLRDSGAIEQDADLVCFLYRDEVYNPETEDKHKAELIIAKHRNGKTGRVHLAYQGNFMRFSNLSYQIPSYLKD